MSFIEAYWASATAFALFGFLHSVGAREPCKNALARWISPFFVEHFWRLIYCALSFAALYWTIASLHWARNPDNDIWLVVYPDWLWQIITAIHLGAIALIYVAFIQNDYFEFLGFKQAWRGLGVMLGRSAREPMRIFGTDRLEVRGVYGWIRHPMLAGGLLFLLTSGPSLNNLIYTALFASYMVIGAHYEERRLIRIFGDEYLRYKHKVGAYLPRLRQLRRIFRSSI
ncbi:MAG: NnrU family protein [Alphaproteobacteria bacterium]|nr:NnrU family protein [Alphaproteobacteria bacterium]